MFTTLGILIVCVVVADIITGVAHWLEDTYCSDDMVHGRLLSKFVGQYVCEPNIDHHLRPRDLVNGGNFVVRNLVPWGLALAAVMLFALIDWCCSWINWPWAVYFTIWLSTFGNEIHRANHMRDSELNPLHLFLRESGLVQSQRQHMLHHKPPFDGYYCAMISFNNAWMDRIHFWRGLEWILFTVFRIPTRREDRRDTFM